jgi:hypothetical protein
MAILFVTIVSDDKSLIPYLHHLHFSNKYREKYSNSNDSYDNVRAMNEVVFRTPNTPELHCVSLKHKNTQVTKVTLI